MHLYSVLSKYSHYPITLGSLASPNVHRRCNARWMFAMSSHRSRTMRVFCQRFTHHRVASSGEIHRFNFSPSMLWARVIGAFIGYSLGRARIWSWARWSEAKSEDSILCDRWKSLVKVYLFPTTSHFSPSSRSLLLKNFLFSYDRLIFLVSLG